MSTHWIRLRAPWRLEPLDAGACWSRRFGRPTGLAESDSVWLVVEDLADSAEVVLNNSTIGSAGGSHGGLRFEVSGKLSPRNKLQLVIGNPGAPIADSQEPPCRVCLVIESVRE